MQTIRDVIELLYVNQDREPAGTMLSGEDRDSLNRILGNFTLALSREVKGTFGLSLNEEMDAKVLGETLYRVNYRVQSITEAVLLALSQVIGRLILKEPMTPECDASFRQTADSC